MVSLYHRSACLLAFSILSLLMSAEIAYSQEAPVELDGLRLEPLTATLNIWCDVDGATIQIDDEIVGATHGGESVGVDVPSGQHSVVVSRDEYEPYERSVDIAAGAVAYLNVTLVAAGQATETPSEDQPEQLSGSQVSEIMRSSRRRIHDCYLRSSAPSGEVLRIDIEFEVQPDGRVSDARTDSDDSAAACVVDAVRDMQFPEFTGDPMDFTYPFRFRRQ